MTLLVVSIIPKLDMYTQIPDAINTCEALTYIDASHYTYLSSGISVGSCVINLFMSVAYYNINIQATVATSSTEAEFISAVSGAKSEEYISSILEDLGLSRQVPTKLFCYNTSAISM